jgi:glycosyltransferase involved in cell wall biosynthesis
MVVYLGNDYDTTLNQGKKKWIGWSTLYRFSIEYCLKTADSVIVRGQYLAKKVSLFNKNVTETFPLGNINLNNVFCQQEKTKEDKHILFLGQVLWLKGLGDLFLALKLVIDSHPEAQIMLDVVGDGSERQEIEEKAKFLNLDAHIKFHGWVEEREKLSNFFNNADVLVVPTSSYPEGVPRVIDEALIQGLPVVATKVGGIAEEFANDEIMLVEPNCSDRLASSIAAILFDAKVRDFYLANMQSRSPKWAEYGSAAKQHKTILLGEYKSI